MFSTFYPRRGPPAGLTPTEAWQLRAGFSTSSWTAAKTELAKTLSGCFASGRRRAFEVWELLGPAEPTSTSSSPTVSLSTPIQKTSLAPEHWRLKSEISAPTFFENKCGGWTAPIEPRTWRSFLLLVPGGSRPDLGQRVRGFKTRRASTAINMKPFERRDPGSSGDASGVLHQGPRPGGFVGGHHHHPHPFGPSTPHLPEGEAATAAYYAGFAAGKDAEASRGVSGISGAAGSHSAGARGEAKKGSSANIWDKINKLASVLVIIALVVSITQIFNIPVLRVTRSGNEISPEDINVTFDDVKGVDEAKAELQEIVDFLMNPEKFSILGGKLPKGCLLVGPPGTGKTLLARAVAGQAGVPFFHASGSEFDEVLVGQGARRVRDLFRAAKGRAPCVIFIDEIDSVGAKRSSSVLHPYANQTINQLLSEMDGFVANEGVIVLGATNRADDLDRALLRPGRFDTQVMVPAPDMKGRQEILRLYLSKIKHDESVDVEKLAKMTVGFTGADLENMVNTSAIRAASEGKDWVTMAEFEYSHDKKVLGTDWKSRVRDKEDLKITAYHEAGHTLVAYFTEDAQPLHKVTIVAKGMSGGHTAFLPEKDTYHETKSQLLAAMDVAMGGRAAEEIIFGKDKVTGGASSDLSGATSTAEVMIKKLGMSEKLGLRVVHDRDGLVAGNDLSPATVEAIDNEVSRVLNDAYQRALKILKNHRKELDMLADALLNYETLDADDIKAIIEGDQSSVEKKMKNSNHIIGLNRISTNNSGGQGQVPAAAVSRGRSSGSGGNKGVDVGDMIV